MVCTHVEISKTTGAQGSLQCHCSLRSTEVELETIFDYKPAVVSDGSIICVDDCPVMLDDITWNLLHTFGRSRFARYASNASSGSVQTRSSRASAQVLRKFTEGCTTHIQPTWILKGCLLRATAGSSHDNIETTSASTMLTKDRQSLSISHESVTADGDTIDAGQN